MGNQCFQRVDRKRNTENNSQNRKSATNTIEIVLQPKTSAKKQSSYPKQNIKQLKEVTLMTKQNKNNLICKICQQNYNLSSNLPVILCDQQHTICLQCKNMLLSSKIVKYRVCPFCKAIVIQHLVRNHQELIKIIKGN